MAILSGPSLYYLYNAIDQPYEDPQYYTYVKKSIDWVNLKYAMFGGVLFGLEMLKFRDIKSSSSPYPR